ncbi:MAG: hypothetical protein WBL95_00180 [Microcoleus sp.]
MYFFELIFWAIALYKLWKINSNAYRVWFLWIYACGKLVKKLAESIAQLSIVKNFLQRQSNVFHKIMVICPQVFPQVSLRELGMGNGELAKQGMGNWALVANNYSLSQLGEVQGNGEWGIGHWGMGNWANREWGIGHW